MAVMISMSSSLSASNGALSSGSSTVWSTRKKSSRAYVSGSTTCNSNQNVIDPYSILSISRGASQKEIKQTYRRLAVQFHPDVCKGESCTASFIQVGEAYKSIMESLNAETSSQSNHEIAYEQMMGVNDNSWEDWEAWMGWEGAGTRDYSSHINYAL